MGREVAFEEDFGSMSVVKDRTVSVLIKNVLITHCPETQLQA